MTDCELLELAAKAAGIKYTKPADDYCGSLGLALEDINGRYIADWSPLTNDGDALRLAVKLVIRLDFAGGLLTIAGAFSEDVRDHNNNADAATRRAIVRAAAGIGKAMKGEPHGL